NAEASEDKDGNNSTPGQMAEGGQNLDFNFPELPGVHPHANQDASILNLFYWNNVIHDIFYHYGFDESSGNFQMNNYDNGGFGNDYVIAQAMDGGGTNNANFYTPIDGYLPRMQMYLWTGPRSLTIQYPPEIEGGYDFAVAAFGQSILQLANEIVLVDDGSISPSLGCNDRVNSSQITGQIALVDRGDCEFGEKCLHAQNAGAVAVIVCNNAPGNPIIMGAGAFGDLVTIPSIMISKQDCDSIKLYLEGQVQSELWVGHPVD